MTLGAHLFGLLEVSQARLEPEATGSGGGDGGSSMEVAARLFSQCVVAWRSLPWARG
jgi:hypothetical protein